MNNDELILSLIEAKKEGLKIAYGDLGFSNIVEEDHLWDLSNNTYTIMRPREYIILVPKIGEPTIISVTNIWNRSDFGLDGEGCEAILMREVFKEDIK